MSYFADIDGLRYNVDPLTKTAVLIQNNTNLSRIQIPMQVDNCYVKEIADDVFNSNQDLQEIYIPDSVRVIHFAAFKNASSLEKVRIYVTDNPASKLDLDMLAFADCKKLEEISMGESCPVVLYNSACVNCISLERFDGDVFVAEDYAFSNCTNLTYIVFASGARWKYTAFQGSKNIKNVTFLGDIGMSFTKSDLRWLRGRTITCPKDSELAELAYTGVNVEVF